MSLAPYDIDTSPPSPELLELAKKQLRETPEVREAAIKELRGLLKAETDLHFADDDVFLTMILRPCHWYPASGIKLLRRIAEFRKEHEKLLKGLLPEHEKKAFIEGKVINVLTNKDHLGRRILVINMGKAWDPEILSTDQIFQLLYMMHIVALNEPSAQINGTVVLMDFEGLSLTQIKAMKPGSTKRLLTFIQDAMPLRLKEIHFVKQPFIFNMVWALIKPFVRDKLKSRMFFQGDDMTKLHKFIPPSHLPADYGGTLPKLDYSGKDWYPCAEKYRDYFVAWGSYGFNQVTK